MELLEAGTTQRTTLGFLRESNGAFSAKGMLTWQT
jgi:hypothetical protein